MKALIVVLVVFGGLHNVFSKLKCESEIIEKCQKEQKKLYELGNAGQGLKELYCKNSQELMDCISKNPDCRGDEIDKYRYTNLEYNVMSLRTGLCPDLQTEGLAKLISKELLHKHEGVDDLGGDQGSDYARELHWKCVQGLLANLHNPKVNLCAAVKKFWGCYDDELRGCKSKLLTHFHHILHNLNQEVLSDVDGRSKMGC